MQLAALDELPAQPAVPQGSGDLAALGWPRLPRPTAVQQAGCGAAPAVAVQQAAGMTGAAPGRQAAADAAQQAWLPLLA